MLYIFKPSGCCSKEMRVELDAKGIIKQCDIVGGCDGNTTGLCKLVAGQDARHVIQRLRGTKCFLFRRSSCPDQLSYALEAALTAQANQ